jgi:alpha-galactosidase
MKKLLLLICCVQLFACNEAGKTPVAAVTDTVPPLNKKLALTPPMGWNSWDCFGWGVTEADVRATADFMAKNLKQLGYEYIIVDQLWYGDSAAIDFEAFVHERIPSKPSYRLDEFGRLWPDTVRFPSSVGNNGFKPLADYIHSLGLKFGVHIVRGIPWSAADTHKKIMGTSIDAATIAQPDKGCDWYDGFYGVDMTKPGSQDYYNSMFKLFADWGLDFVKADDMVNLPEIKAASIASRLSGRDIVLSVVPSDDVHVGELKQYAHMARTGFDFWDVWQMLKVGFPVAARVVKDAEPGFWPDLDMLPIGKIGKKISYKGPHERISNFNEAELHTLFSLWYISKMPLMIGGYLPESDSLTIRLLKNKEALDVHKLAVNPRQVKFKNAYITWAADVDQSNDKFVAFFNQWESVEPILQKISFAELGLKGSSYRVKDLWTNKDLGKFDTSFTALIGAHGAGLYRIIADEK